MKSNWRAAALVVATLVLLGLPAPTIGEYPIPADAIRVGARELAAQQVTDHLALLMGNASIHHDASVPPVLQRLSALLSAAEQRKNRILNDQRATSRFLSINRSAYFRGLLIVWLPVSFLLPTLARTYDGPDIEANYFTKRQLSLNYDPESSLYKFEPHYGPLLSRMEAYFDLMRVENVYCRWKLVCYASNQPSTYQPLSNLFRKLFERGQKFSSKHQTYHPALKLFHAYVWADKKGARFNSARQCEEDYGKQCPLPPSALIRTDMLDFWQKLSERFAIQLQDE